MVEPVSIASYRDDTLWAVVASIGRTSRVAEVFSSRLAALSGSGLAGAASQRLRQLPEEQPAADTVLSVRPIRRADLPRTLAAIAGVGFFRENFFKC